MARDVTPPHLHIAPDAAGVILEGRQTLQGPLEAEGMEGICERNAPTNDWNPQTKFTKKSTVKYGTVQYSLVQFCPVHAWTVHKEEHRT